MNIVLDNDTIIISMTSWPPRINSVRMAYDSILRQTKGKNVHCVLVLSEEEFPRKEEHLPCDVLELRFKGVEIIWDKGNIRSHKKLIPTLEKYPNNAVIVVDDDMAMKNGWLDEMLSEHSKYPQHILYGQSSSTITIDSNGNITENRYCENGCRLVQISGAESTIQKPANGSCGTLYPANTFTRKEFFDRELFMKLSPTSDETWQWAWANIEGRKFRAISKFNLPFVLKANYDVSLFKKNKNLYNTIHNNIANVFPEYREAMYRIKPKLIISLTTHGKRLKYLHFTLFSLVNQMRKADKIIINITNADLEKISNETKYVLENFDNVEIFIVPKDFKSHNKYYWTFKRFPNDIVILVDDDVIYDERMTYIYEQQFNRMPHCVMSGRVRKINDSENYFSWPLVSKSCDTDVKNVGMGFGSMMIPPKSIHDLIDIEFAFSEFQLDDDLYLRYVQNMRNIKVRFIQLCNNDIKFIQVLTEGLCKIGNKKERCMSLINKFGINKTNK